MMPSSDPWKVQITTRANKDKEKLPLAIQDQIVLLVKEMVFLGPYRKDWKNYGPLQKGKGIPDEAFHC